MNIAKANISGSFTASNKTYDGTATATVTSTSLSPVMASFTYSDGTETAVAQLNVTRRPMAPIWPPVVVWSSLAATIQVPIR